MSFVGYNPRGPIDITLFVGGDFYELSLSGGHKQWDVISLSTEGFSLFAIFMLHLKNKTTVRDNLLGGFNCSQKGRTAEVGTTAV